MKMLSMFRISLLLLTVFAFTGCDKISPEARVLIESATLQAKERALSFNLIVYKLAPVTVEDTDAFNRYITAHQTTLDAIAAGMRDVSEALKKNNRLEDRTIQQLQSLGETMKACSENFKAFDLKFVAKNPTDAGITKAWADSHREGLDKMVELFNKLREALEKSKNKSQSSVDGMSFRELSSI